MKHLCLILGLITSINLFSGPLSNSFTNDNIVYSRRGNLSKNDYVVTSVLTNRYPMFLLALNDSIPNYIVTTNSSGVVTSIELDEDDPYSLTNYLSLELKATTNNFYHTSSDHVPGTTNEHEKILFWCASALR